MRTVHCFLVALSLLVLSLPAGAEKHEATFTFRLRGQPVTLDWNRAHTTVEANILLNLMEGLATHDRKLQVVPALAAKWTLSPDALTYTFSLRPGVTWSDGVPLRAQDFVYSWKRLLAASTASAYAYLLFDIEGAREFSKGTLTDFNKVGIKALNDRTLQVRLSQKIANWPQVITMWPTFPLREDVVAKHGPGWEKPGKMVTVGPFVLERNDLDERIVLAANPRYHGTRGNIRRVTAIVAKDDSTAIHLYETGRLDFLPGLSSFDIKRFRGRNDLKEFPFLKTSYLGFVVTDAAAKTKALRRAIGMAIDKSKIGHILFGGQKPASSFIPPGLPGHSAKLGLPFDPAKARALLKESGTDPKATQLRLLVLNSEKELTLSEFIQSQLRTHLGLQIEILAYDHKTFRSQLDTYASPVFENTWAADYPDPENFLSVFVTGSGTNRTRWSAPEYDKAVMEEKSAENDKARVAAVLKAQKILLENHAAIIPLYYEVNTALQKPDFDNVHLNSLGHLYMKDIVRRP